MKRRRCPCFCLYGKKKLIAFRLGDFGKPAANQLLFNSDTTFAMVTPSNAMVNSFFLILKECEKWVMQTT